jgi:hypothetical protein
LNYSLFLPSSVFGVVHEESVAKLVVREQELLEKQKNNCSRAERRGEGREEFPLHNTRRDAA